MTRENKIKNEIKNIILSEKDTLTGFKVFFFGSRVKSTPKKRSDFDIGISSSSKVNLKTFFRLEEKLESINTLYKIDLVDFNNVSDQFRNEAMKNTEVILG